MVLLGGVVVVDPLLRHMLGTPCHHTVVHQMSCAPSDRGLRCALCQAAPVHVFILSSVLHPPVCIPCVCVCVCVCTLERVNIRTCMRVCVCVHVCA